MYCKYSAVLLCSVRRTASRTVPTGPVMYGALLYSRWYVSCCIHLRADLTFFLFCSPPTGLHWTYWTCSLSVSPNHHDPSHDPAHLPLPSPISFIQPGPGCSKGTIDRGHGLGLQLDAFRGATGFRALGALGHWGQRTIGDRRDQSWRARGRNGASPTAMRASLSAMHARASWARRTHPRPSSCLVVGPSSPSPILAPIRCSPPSSRCLQCALPVQQCSSAAAASCPQAFMHGPNPTRPDTWDSGFFVCAGCSNWLPG